ncbi:hypothetical protein BDQ17DRAFT_1329661 [Cyathus striatus]|nr:hypothetical protein BDQ17DRAFT_1329661 [Cyathus striatus]
MTEDNCALNCNGMLKDASEIQWHYDPDDKMPLPKNNKRARIEISSKVSSDSEGEEDDEDMDGFINNEDQDEEDPNTSIVRLTLQRSFYAHLQNEDKKQHIMDHLHSGGGDLASLQAEQRIDNHHELISEIFATMDLRKMWYFPSAYMAAQVHSQRIFVISHPGHVYVEAKCLDNLRPAPEFWQMYIKTVSVWCRLPLGMSPFQKLENAIFHPRTHGSNSEEGISTT